MIKDISYITPLGFVDIEEVASDGTIVKTHKSNLVVNGARTIIRDLLNNPSSNLAITTLQVGDMHLGLTDPVNNLPPPTVADTGLVNAFFTKSYSTKTPLTMYSRAALLTTFSIASNEANDPNPLISSKLITELGLFTTSGTMFSRVVLPIIKTRDIGLNITWSIVI